MTRRAGGWARVIRPLLMLLCLVWLSGAGAHAFLVNTIPRAGARFTDAPDQLALQFSEPVSLRSAQLGVRALNEGPLDVGELRPGADGRNLLATLPPLKSGVYVVSWQVLASDGHLSSGEFAFGVGAQGAIPGLQDNADTLPLPWVAGSALLLVGFALGLGGWISERYVWRRQWVPHAWIGLGAVLASHPGGTSALALLAFLVSVWLAGGRARAWVSVPLVGGALAAAL